MRYSSQPTYEQFRAQQRAQFVNGFGIPDLHLAAIRAGSLLATLALEAVAANLAAILLLAGGVGIGKTLAAAWGLHRWGMDEKNWDPEPYGKFLRGQGLFITAGRYLELDRYNREHAEEMELVRRARFLVLDDVGVEALDEKGFGPARIDSLVDERYCDRGVTTIVTTNLSQKTFKARYGARVMDRLRERGRWVSLGDGPSLRGRP